MELEKAYLKHILLFLSSRDPDDGLLKTLLNSWFAHSRGAPFVDTKGKPRWLSRKESKRLLAKDLHASSAAARRALEEGRLDDLVIDHTIPSAELVRGLKARHARRPFSDVADLQTYLKPRFTLTLLTKMEHDHGLKPMKSRMPAGWCDDRYDTDQSDRYSRYGPTAANLDFDIH